MVSKKTTTVKKVSKAKASPTKATKKETPAASSAVDGKKVSKLYICFHSCSSYPITL